MKISIGRRSAALLTTGALVLTGAGSAIAAQTQDYAGNPDSGTGYMTAEVEKTQQKRLVDDFSYNGLTTCTGDSPTNYTIATATKKFKLNKAGKFDGESPATFNTEGAYTATGTMKVTGKLARGEITGTVRITEVRKNGGQVIARCNTGLLDYTLGKAQED